MNRLARDCYKVSIEDIHNSLDPDQKEAVICEPKNTCVIANAGSGKTRVLINRIAYLNLKYDVPLKDIMAITFTNKAAGEMKERIEGLVGERPDALIATIHSISLRFLREYYKYTGYPQDFLIMDQKDSSALIKKCADKFKEGKSKEEKKRYPAANVLQRLFSKSINKKVKLKILCEEKDYEDDETDFVIATCNEYARRKHATGRMDFDDLIYKFFLLLRKNPNIAREISERYPYILVDEFQDINWIQYEIIKLLNWYSNKLFAVGDPNQSIYKFRGSCINYIMDFEEEFKNTQVLSLKYNYRSDGKILNFAEDSINRNYQKRPVRIKPNKKSEMAPLIVNAGNSTVQNRFMMKKIKQLKMQGVEYKDIAVLIRTNSISKNIEIELQKNRIPYKLIGGKPFFERQHIKDLLAFMLFRINPKDDVSFDRIATLFEGIGAKTVEKIYRCLMENGFEFDKFINVENLSFRTSGKAKKNISKLMHILSMNAKLNNPNEIISNVVENFYADRCSLVYEDYTDRLQDIEYITNSAEEYESILEFLENAILLDSVAEDDGSDDKITISTMHKAKGLEWDYVFLPYMNDRHFPDEKKNDAEEEEEEERRLFYVAVTRARKELFFLFGDFFNEKKEPVRPSKFLKEVDDLKFRSQVVRTEQLIGA